MPLKQTFRWFGSKDPVSLAAIRQTGASGVVTALHSIPCGEIWPTQAIKEMKCCIEKAGLSWAVVESLNIHEDIKRGLQSRDYWIENYLESLRNLASQNIFTICYNFMPILDWTRTDLAFQMEDGALALRFDEMKIAAFDAFILKRKGAELLYHPSVLEAAENWYNTLTDLQAKLISDTIMAGIPGTGNVYELNEFKALLASYENVGHNQLKENLSYFLKAVVPTAETLGIKLCIHPDDPPFSVLGLPRIVSNEADLQFILDCAPSKSNGITFCTGSLGADARNDLPSMIEKFGPRIHFFHLRNVRREEESLGNSRNEGIAFHEDQHLAGSTDMYLVMKAILEEIERRKDHGNEAIEIPIRPDHGHKLLYDHDQDLFPGYSFIGRLKGLAELRGLELGIHRSLFQ